MKLLLALAGIALLVTACAAPAEVSTTAQDSPGAGVAQALGYHGPLHRADRKYGN